MFFFSCGGYLNDFFANTAIARHFNVIVPWHKCELKPEDSDMIIWSTCS
jgi:hypothetical protein